MATFKYFYDLGDEPEQLQAITQMANGEFRTRWPGARGLRADGYTMWVGTGAGGVRPVTRKIEFKPFPSLHRCNAKCLGGKPTGVCECQCGGRNHGRQLFSGLISTGSAAAHAIAA
jgi:hypothetical protein